MMPKTTMHSIERSEQTCSGAVQADGQLASVAPRLLLIPTPFRECLRAVLARCVTLLRQLVRLEADLTLAIVQARLWRLLQKPLMLEVQLERWLCCSALSY